MQSYFRHRRIANGRYSKLGKNPFEGTAYNRLIHKHRVWQSLNRKRARFSLTFNVRPEIISLLAKGDRSLEKMMMPAFRNSAHLDIIVVVVVAVVLV